MIIFLYGPDDYRREQKKWEILLEFKKKRSDLGVGRFDLSGDGEFEKFQDFLKNQSLFQVAKMAVLENSFQVLGDKLKVELKKILKEVIENKDVTVLISEKDKPIKTLDFLLKGPVLAQTFEILKGGEWESFVRREIKKREMEISPDGARFLAQVYEGNTWAFITELDKIQHLGSPPPSHSTPRVSDPMGSESRTEIDTRDLEDLGIEQVPSFWSLIWGFKSPDIKQRMWALEKVLGSNEQPAKIFNILAYQLPGKLQDLARYDLMVKSGKLEYEEALVDLVIR